MGVWEYGSMGVGDDQPPTANRQPQRQGSTASLKK